MIQPHRKSIIVVTIRVAELRHRFHACVTKTSAFLSRRKGWNSFLRIYKYESVVSNKDPGLDLQSPAGAVSMVS